jgi:hypothetical protein
MKPETFVDVTDLSRLATNGSAVEFVAVYVRVGFVFA